MTEWKARRFWKRADIQASGNEWEILLDGRTLRTPGKLPLLLPTEALAQAIAAEWDAQQEYIRPDTMPLTRAANSAIEKVAPQSDAVADMLAEYGGTDLLCYRAEAPEDLVRLQAEGWDPLIDWAATELQAPLLITCGVLPIRQPPESLARLRGEVGRLDIYALTALHEVVTVTGSLLLGLAVLKRRLTVADVYVLARMDENYQINHWGTDEEAALAAAIRRVAIEDAVRFWELTQPEA